MEKQKKSISFVRKISDPFTLITILSLVNFIVILVFYYNIPLFTLYDLEQETQTTFLYNGYYETIEIGNATIIESGISEIFPIEASRLLQSGLILMICANSIQLIAIFLAKNMTRKKFISIFSWPNFVFNAFILISVLLFAYWPIGNPGEDILTEMFVPIKYGLFMSLLMLILTIAVVIYISQISEEKRDTN